MIAINAAAPPIFAEIGGDDGDLGARCGELRCKRFHRLAATSDQHEVVPVFGGLARQFSTDAARRAGHQRNGTGGDGTGKFGHLLYVSDASVIFAAMGGHFRQTAGRIN